LLLMSAAGEDQPFAVCLMRRGPSTTSDITAAMMLRIAATMKTAIQLSPVASYSTFPRGTNSAAVPFAVYSEVRLADATYVELPMDEAVTDGPQGSCVAWP
jgi:hypothetical protein